MKQLVKLLAILILAVVTSSCAEKGYVSYSFEVTNNTTAPLTISLSSWGGYHRQPGIYTDMPSLRETVTPHSTFYFIKLVDDDPDPNKIPSSLTPIWEYITKLECNGTIIAKEYFTNRKNWELEATSDYGEKVTKIKLNITPQVLEQFRENGLK